MSKFSHFAALFLGLVIALAGGCGGGSGGGGSVAPRDGDPGGLWSGTLVVDGVPGTQDMVGISVADGRFRMISVDTGGQFVGTVRVSGSSVSGSGKAYAPAGTTWRDGSTVTTVSCTGTLAERRSLDGSWSTGAGESGTVSLDYDPDYEKDSALARVAGTWIVYDDALAPIATFTIEANGNLFAQNAIGCTTTGRISLIDARYNVYDVVTTVSGCPIAGDYTGLGTLGDLESPDDALVLGMSNEARALLVLLQR